MRDRLTFEFELCSFLAPATRYAVKYQELLLQQKGDRAIRRHKLNSLGMLVGLAVPTP